MFKYIFFLNLEIIQLKLLKDLVHISLPISEEQKTNANKLSLDFFANCCVRCCDVTYKMIRVEEKKENHMVDINRKQF
jgi:hypothetical protein